MESMIGLDLIGLSVPLLILLLGVYVVGQARRSRESELTYKLRKSQIALHDAEQALDNTVSYYKAEIQRLRARLGEADAPPPSANGNGEGYPGDIKFRQAKKPSRACITRTRSPTIRRKSVSGPNCSRNSGTSSSGSSGADRGRSGPKQPRTISRSIRTGGNGLTF